MPKEHQELQRDNAVKMGEYLREKLLERVENPGDDMLSEMVQAQIRRDGTFDLDDVRTQAGSVMAGGVLTTAHSIGSTMLLLLRHPEQLERARGDSLRIERVIDEAICVESPVQWVPRVATEDVELGGTTIPAGSHVLVMWGSANRDTDFWEELPDIRLSDDNEFKHIQSPSFRGLQKLNVEFTPAA